MNTVGFITKNTTSGISYFYSIVNDTITVQESSQADHIIRKKMVDMKSSAVLILFETFLEIDSKVIDPGKDVFSYTEKQKGLRKYIEWGHENRDAMPESVIQNARIMTKGMNSMIKHLADTNPSKKELIFIMQSVIDTCDSPYNI